MHWSKMLQKSSAYACGQCDYNSNLYGLPILPQRDQRSKRLNLAKRSCQRKPSHVLCCHVSLAVFGSLRHNPLASAAESVQRCTEPLQASYYSPEIATRIFGCKHPVESHVTCPA